MSGEESQKIEQFVWCLFEMVEILHQDGFQGLRLHPYIAPVGAWRLEFDPSPGMEISYPTSGAPRYSTASGLGFSDWDFSSEPSAELLAEFFRRDFGSMCEACSTEDPAYAQWYSFMLGFYRDQVQKVPHAINEQQAGWGESLPGWGPHHPSGIYLCAPPDRPKRGSQFPDESLQSSARPPSIPRGSEAEQLYSRLMDVDGFKSSWIAYWEPGEIEKPARSEKAVLGPPPMPKGPPIHPVTRPDEAQGGEVNRKPLFWLWLVIGMVGLVALLTNI
jgi:hypothetical protein